MALPLAATYNMEAELREAGQYGATLRLMQIRPNRGSMTPQLTAGLDIAWSRPSSHSGEMSGLCYYYGAQRIKHAAACSDQTRRVNPGPFGKTSSGRTYRNIHQSPALLFVWQANSWCSPTRRYPWV